jgi:hypothetical protein
MDVTHHKELHEMTLRHPAEDLANRTPVWVAMTEFFLDTELTDVTVSYIAKTCAASPYSVPELQRILFTEVWPAFLPNLLSVAGEWAGWPEEFVKSRVLERYRPRLYLSWKLNPLKRFFCHQWPAVEQRIVSTRNGE